MKESEVRTCSKGFISVNKTNTSKLLHHCSKLLFFKRNKNKVINLHTCSETYV